MSTQEDIARLQDTTICRAERMAHDLHVKLEELAHGEREQFDFSFTTGEVGGSTTQILNDLAHLALFERIGASCSIDEPDKFLTNFGNVALQKEAIIPRNSQMQSGVRYTALRTDIF